MGVMTVMGHIIFELAPLRSAENSSGRPQDGVWQTALRLMASTGGGTDVFGLFTRPDGVFGIVSCYLGMYLATAFGRPDLIRNIWNGS